MKKFYIIGAIFLGIFTLVGCQQTKQMNEKVAETSEISSSANMETSKSSSIAEAFSTTSTERREPVINYPSGSLLQAVQENNLESIKAILKDTSYQIDEVNEQQETPLLIATHNSQIEAAKLLIDAGADVNKQDVIQDSPYLYAGAQGKTEILAYILKNAEPNQNVVNRFGGNALIPAAEKGHLENVRLLLADGRANINHQNNFGYTALIEAVALTDGSQVYQDIVSELLKYNADTTLKDNYGYTALDYAYEKGYTIIANLIQNGG